MTARNTVSDIYTYLDKYAPFASQLSWDNSGLLAGDMRQEVRTCVLALDMTSEVIRFAAERGASLIFTHHPVIFGGGLSNVTSDSLVWRLIRENISVISAHTNLDLAQGGVNDALAEALMLEKRRPFENEDGLGIIGELPREMEPAALAMYIKEKLGEKSDVAYTAKQAVRTLAVVGGSGGDYLDAAVLCGADGYLTGEMKHHEWMAAQEKPLTVLTAGHYATEAVVLPALQRGLARRFPETAFLLYESAAVVSL